MYRTEDHRGKWNKQDLRLHFSLLWDLGKIDIKERQVEDSSLGMEKSKGRRGQEGLQRGERALSILYVLMEMSQENPVIRTINES